MKQTRPWTLIAAAILMVIVMLVGYGLPALFPRLGFAAAGRFPNGAQANGGVPNGGQANGGNNFGGRPFDGGNDGGGARQFGGGNGFGGGGNGFGGGRQFGGGGAFGGGNPLGAAGTANNSFAIVNVVLQTVFRILGIGFVGLGLIGALGLFKMKRWGLVLTIILFVLATVGLFLPQATLLRLAIGIMNPGRTAGNFANAGLLAGRFNWVSLIEPVGLLAVLVLALLPMSRKAMAPVTDEDFGDDDYTAGDNDNGSGNEESSAHNEPMTGAPA